MVRRENRSPAVARGPVGSRMWGGDVLPGFSSQST